MGGWFKKASKPPCCSCIYSLDKHRHQIWHHCYFSFKYWNNKLALNFATIYHNKTKKALSDGFHLIPFFQKKMFFFFLKELLFILAKTYFKGKFLFQNFKSYIFALLTLFDFKVLVVYFDLCLFFSWIKIDFALQKALAEFFL